MSNRTRYLDGASAWLDRAAELRRNAHRLPPAEQEAAFRKADLCLELAAHARRQAKAAGR